MGIEVSDYDPAWVVGAAELESRLWPEVRRFSTRFEHVGSTSVPGLAAKPVLDLDICIRDGSELDSVVGALEPLGYAHRGELGIAGRHAFRSPEGGPRHHLYVCVEGSLGLRNHLVLRDHLRGNPADAAAYGALKKHLAATQTEMAGYVEGKTAFITRILALYDAMDPADIAAIIASNRA